MNRSSLWVLWAAEWLFVGASVQASLLLAALGGWLAGASRQRALRARAEALEGGGGGGEDRPKSGDGDGKRAGMGLFIFFWLVLREGKGKRDRLGFHTPRSNGFLSKRRGRQQ